MHLLNAQQVGADTDEAVDLGQTPGDIIVISAAETELLSLSAAQAGRSDQALSLRLANQLTLSHPYSIDLYLDNTVRHAKLVVARLLGGRAYWTYGLDRLAALCRSENIPLAALPGDRNPDPELFEISSVPPIAYQRLWGYLREGGAINAGRFLEEASALAGRGASPGEPEPLPKAGLYRAQDQPAGGPLAVILFYRALQQAGDTKPVDALIEALAARGMRSKAFYTTSLKDPDANRIIEQQLSDDGPALFLNATSFAASTGADNVRDAFPGAHDRPVLQVIFSSRSEAEWRESSQGLSARELAMHVALPEVDGRITTHAVAFKGERRPDPLCQIPLARLEPLDDRIEGVAALARRWASLSEKPENRRKIAILLANYPTRNARIGNGVGLDAAESVVLALHRLAEAGYSVRDLPETGADLMVRLLQGPTNQSADGFASIRVSLEQYRSWLARLPDEIGRMVSARWGPPDQDPGIRDGAFALAVLVLGRAIVGIQPARGYHIDPLDSYHDPDLVPPHGYLAFYLWLRFGFGADALVQMGKHGNLEWLPGKALALSESCFPQAILGPLPHIYPFIVNDPGEGSQAKRRTQAVILDHLTPPLARAEAYGSYLELERMVDEYVDASAFDPRRASLIAKQINEEMERIGLDRELGDPADTTESLKRLDNRLCELKELQIRDGLHVFGQAPEPAQRLSLLQALLRMPQPGKQETSLLRALAQDLDLDGFDPLTTDYAEPWTGPRPRVLAAMLTERAWRTAGDTIERLEHLAAALIAGRIAPDPAWAKTLGVLAWSRTAIEPRLDDCAEAEAVSLLAALDGRLIAPGPSGAPTRGRPEVLPTGRNFYSVDTRAVPTPAAWQLGWASAEAIMTTYLQDHGDWPKRIVLSAWGTANMRTGGDDLAQALALMGVRPVWDASSNRITGTEIIPLDALGRPRVDVLFRVSGFFRDAFPDQMALIDRAAQAVAALDESPDENPLAAAVQSETVRLTGLGLDEKNAKRRAGFRVFGSKPGAYGAGLQALIDEGVWADDADIAETYLAWGGYAYGAGLEGAAATDELGARLAERQLVLHNQDNREHDILDSDDYYQFEGGVTAAVRHLSGRQPEVFHNDHSRPESPKIRRLDEEIALIVRGRAANPKWIKGMMRHGYKGAFEIAATVDYLFAFAATTGLVSDHHFDLLFDAYLLDQEVRGFMAQKNPDALRDMASRFEEAVQRGLWHPRRNDWQRLVAQAAD
ncbi:MAG: cobaltochelatase subunit CobN [Geminicoccaceae bacterium]